MQAEIQIILIVPSGNAAMQIGIKIPKVPHDVPVANARKHAMMKMIAGRNILRPAAEPSTRPAT